MGMCLECINSLCAANEKITEEEVIIENSCCEKCGKNCECVIGFWKSAVPKIKGKLYDELILQKILEWIERWDDPDFQEEKARIRREVGLGKWDEYFKSVRRKEDIKKIIQ